MRGTIEGEKEEVRIVKEINSRTKLGVLILNTMGIESNEDIYALQVTRMIYGEIQKQKVKPKSDIYLFNGVYTNSELEVKNYYFSDLDIEDFIVNTGISVKLSDSKKYQILKINPATFEKLFQSNVLAAGASIYCNSVNEFSKNTSVLSGWGVSINEFEIYFKDIISEDFSVSNADSKGELKLIKKHSNNEIKNIIKNNQEILDYAFKGTGNFNEPYVAHWIYVSGKFQKLEPYDFNVTTGSGRSKGDFTIVLKPC